MYKYIGSAVQNFIFKTTACQSGCAHRDCRTSGIQIAWLSQQPQSEIEFGQDTLALQNSILLNRLTVNQTNYYDDICSRQKKVR